MTKHINFQNSENQDFFKKLGIPSVSQVKLQQMLSNIHPLLIAYIFCFLNDYNTDLKSLLQYLYFQEAISVS